MALEEKILPRFGIRNEEILMDFTSKCSIKIQARNSKLPQLLPLLMLWRGFCSSISSSLRHSNLYLFLQFPHIVYLLEENL